MNRVGYPTHPYGPYRSLAQVGGMGGAMMASQMAMRGQQQSSMMGVQPNSMIGVQQSCVMGQQNGLMGAQGAMAQPGSVVASPYMAGMSQGTMGQQQSGVMAQQQSGMMGQQQSGVMGHQQMGGLASVPQQQVYGVQQPQQQLQWNVSQVCALALDHAHFEHTASSAANRVCFVSLQVTQHVAGVNLYNTNGMMGYGSQHMGSSAAPSSAHMTAHVWK